MLPPTGPERCTRCVWLVLAAAILAGCGGRQVLMNGDDLDRGLLIVLPGIDGRALHNELASRRLSEAGLGLAVELYDWTAPLGPLFNQCAYERNRQVAAALAERVGAYRQEHPGGSVFLIGHSGGTAIAVWAAECLDAGERIDGVVLLASSLSPTYDLGGALAHTRCGIVSFHSARDVALLGAGTTWFGTMDRAHGESAGKVGFRRPAAGLHQIAWRDGMARHGHDGGHFSCLAPDFVCAYVAPLLAAKDWNEDVMTTVRRGEGRLSAAAPGDALALTGTDATGRGGL